MGRCASARHLMRLKCFFVRELNGLALQRELDPKGAAPRNRTGINSCGGRSDPLETNPGH